MMLCRTVLLPISFVLALTGAPAVAHAADADCDGVEDTSDNCPDAFNPAQGDLDADTIGDACDTDRDDDGVTNDADNCVRDANADQADADADGAGDACDACAGTQEWETANRRGCSIDQLCPCSGPDADTLWKSAEQYQRCVKRKVRRFRRHRLIDRDLAREYLLASRTNGCGTPVPSAGDNDGDGVGDETDNCPSDSNPSQLNTDGDAFGDACDRDRDDDDVRNRDDNCPAVANADGQGDDADGDTVGDACDACPATGLAAPVDRAGCSIDQACRCDVDDEGDPWKSHREYTRCVRDEVFRFRQLRVLSDEQALAIQAAAAASSCGERPPVCE